MRLISSLVRHTLRRMRRGPRRALPPYVLFVPREYTQPLAAPLQAAIELHAQGWADGAAADLRALASRAPQDGAVQALLGQVLLETGDRGAAKSALARARELAPKLADELIEASLDERSANRRREALGGLMLACLLKPAAWSSKSLVADVYYEMGELGEARAWVDAALRQSRRDSLRIKRLILELTPIYHSVAHLQEARARYLEGMAELERAEVKIENVLAEVNLTNFYLPYQGMNERETQTRLAAILLKATPELGYVAQHCRNPRSPGERLRIGVVSRFFGPRHSIGIAYNQLIRELAGLPEFELCAICFADGAADHMKQLLGEGSAAVVLPKAKLADAREKLAALELDVLLYTDIGMEPYTYYLAFGRYAPVQGVLGGHPLTTGIPALDIYFSSQRLEAPEAQEHYSERLVRLEHWPMGMEPPKLAAPRRREDLGLPAHGNLYVCPLKLQKFHPEFDAALAAILEADPEAEIVLFEDNRYDSWDRKVRERLTRTLGQGVERVTFLPWQSAEDFLAILASCGVALDTFHFGAGTTAPLAIGVGCPMVTWPPRFQRGRSTLACYLTMGIDDCIAADRDDYVRRAVGIARDPAYRAQLSARLLAAAPVLFDNQPSARELGDVLLRLRRGP